MAGDEGIQDRFNDVAIKRMILDVENRMAAFHRAVDAQTESDINMLESMLATQTKQSELKDSIISYFEYVNEKRPQGVSSIEELFELLEDWLGAEGYAEGTIKDDMDVLKACAEAYYNGEDLESAAKNAYPSIAFDPDATPNMVKHVQQLRSDFLQHIIDKNHARMLVVYDQIKAETEQYMPEVE